MDQALITRIVEAALLAANQPLTLAQLHALFPEDQPAPNDSVEQALEALRDGCADRGVELVEVASGFRFQVKADVHPWVARLWTERQTRYTRATLETLALIAYRQPITRGEIEQVRGVAVSSNIIKALEEREWIRVVGHRDVPGKPALFGTTKAFLDYFGLKRLDELPPLSELKDIGELEPQLAFDGAPIAAGGIGADGRPGDAANADDAGTADGALEHDEDDNDDLAGDEHEDDRVEGFDADADDADDDAHASDTDSDTDHSTPDSGRGDTAAGFTASTGEPEAAPGERAADENDREQDNAVETTTVPETQAGSDTDQPEQQRND
ncbi:SMC-Scp complex subunit ScpB [Cognatilysobacter tabacisoli]|uniref:SMC-Scp complex subunit ScpB n=1 Tax=Cognatilysobacter tabacisoli TaxID=2315424 RepID=UPI000E6B05B2|nr:SMC-Scp complex subunit ScpB [Lysobacter tabacisoli]